MAESVGKTLPVNTGKKNEGHVYAKHTGAHRTKVLENKAIKDILVKFNSIDSKVLITID